MPSVVDTSKAPGIEEQKRGTVMVVEGDWELRQFVCACLENDCQTIAVSDGREAMEAAKKVRPDLIVSDVFVPGLNGTEFVKEIKGDEELADVPVMVVTGQPDEKLKISVFALGVQDYITKPFPADELRARVQNLLKAKRARDVLQQALDSKSHDLTELAAEMAARARELVRAKEAAEAANQTKDRFLAVLSHELRTPLTPVLTAAELLGSPFKLDAAEVKRQSDLIRRNILLEARLIDDLLDLTRISHGKLRLRLQEVDIHETIREAVQFCEEEAAKRAVRIELHFHAATHTMRGDPARLLQLFWNILSNAVKYSNAGGSVTVTSENRDGRLSVAVADQGLGMTAEELAQIFDPFRQTNTPLIPSSGGLELGLAIAKGLVEAHGGSLNAESAGKGRGAVFTADFPEAAPATKPGAHEPKTSANGTTTPIETILLVDDHQDTRRALASLLVRNGYKVLSASGVKEAMDLARTETFDFLVSDISMPDGSGLELMEQLRSSGVRGVAISGFGTEDDHERSRAAGFSEHITKPISFGALQETLRRLSSAGQSETRNSHPGI